MVLFIVIGADVDYLEVLNSHYLHSHIFEQDVSPEVMNDTPFGTEQCDKLITVQLSFV